MYVIVKHRISGKSIAMKSDHIMKLHDYFYSEACIWNDLSSGRQVVSFGKGVY